MLLTKNHRLWLWIWCNQDFSITTVKQHFWSPNLYFWAICRGRAKGMRVGNCLPDPTLFASFLYKWIWVKDSNCLFSVNFAYGRSQWYRCNQYNIALWNKLWILKIRERLKETLWRIEMTCSQRGEELSKNGIWGRINAPCAMLQ